MEITPFTVEIGIVLGLVCVTIVLFLTEWLRVDVVAILIMVALPLLGIVDGRETFRGLSSNAVISIIAVIIMGRGLDHTGVINRLMKPLMRLAGTSRSKILILIAGTVAVISSFMQNVGAAALFLPAIRRLSRRSCIPVSQLLMPVGFSAILGGTVTLVGSSPLIMLNDLIRPYGMAPFSLFSVLPVGLALVVAGIVYFMVAGNLLLPGKKECDIQEREEEDFMVFYPQVGRLFELTVPTLAEYQLRGKDFCKEDLLRVKELCEAYRIHPVAVCTNGEKETLMPPDRSMRIPAGATMAAFGTPANVVRLYEEQGITAKEELGRFSEAMSDDLSGVVEALVPLHSRFIGKTVREVRFRHNHLMAPLVVTRGNEIYYSGFQDIVLAAGDSLLMHGSWESFQAMRPRRDILFVKALDHEVLHPEKAWCALASFGLATLLVIFSDLTISVCLMTGALSMILAKVLTIDEAYRGVDWRTVFLLGGLIPLGLAMQTTGAAAWIAGHLMGMIGSPAPVVFIFFVGAISTLFTLVVSNVGAVVLLVPLVVDMAGQLGADPRLAALVVALAASNSFVLPTHQVNALYMGPGHYTSMDFLRAGTPLTLIFLVVMTAMISIFY